jgi:hypothetical protein
LLKLPLAANSGGISVALEDNAGSRATVEGHERGYKIGAARVLSNHDLEELIIR